MKALARSVSQAVIWPARFLLETLGFLLAAIVGLSMIALGEPREGKRMVRVALPRVVFASLWLGVLIAIAFAARHIDHRNLAIALRVHSWYPVGAMVLYALLRLLQRHAQLRAIVWDVVPDGYKPLIPMAIGMAGGLVEGWLCGASFSEVVFEGVGALFCVGAAASGLHAWQQSASGQSRLPEEKILGFRQDNEQLHQDFDRRLEELGVSPDELDLLRQQSRATP